MSDAMWLWPEGAPGAAGEGPEDRPRLTPYLAGRNRPHGAVIVCPGGGYGTRAPHEGAPVARRLNAFGLSAYVLDYRVAPYRHPYPLLDAQRAIRTVRHRAERDGIDPQRIAILGFSAGGHLASSAGTHFDAGDPNHADPIERESSRPDAMILCYPVISLSADYGHQGSARNLLGPDAPEELRRRLSSEQQVTEATPPAFLWHTADDAGVPVQNSLAMVDALRRHGVPCELHVYESGRHGLGLADGHPAGDWTARLALWLAGRGFGAQV